MKQRKRNADAYSAQNPFPAHICKPRRDASRSQRAVQRNKTNWALAALYHGSASLPLLLLTRISIKTCGAVRLVRRLALENQLCQPFSKTQ